MATQRTYHRFKASGQQFEVSECGCAVVVSFILLIDSSILSYVVCVVLMRVLLVYLLCCGCYCPVFSCCTICWVSRWNPSFPSFGLLDMEPTES
jgi:hypothetical protein